MRTLATGSLLASHLTPHVVYPEHFTSPATKRVSGLNEEVEIGVCAETTYWMSWALFSDGLLPLPPALVSAPATAVDDLHGAKACAALRKTLRSG